MGFPSCLSAEKDRSTHFCINYRQVNAVACKNAYPLPCVYDTLDTLAGAK